MITGKPGVAYSIASCLGWLDGRIRDDGSAGSDYWDAAQLGIFIEKHNLQSHFSAYQRLNQYLVTNATPVEIRSSASNWRGPGFAAAALEYLQLTGTHGEQRDALLDFLLHEQDEKGCWHGPIGKTGTPLASPVWHTAQVARLLFDTGDPKTREAASRGMQWLADTQDSDGSWSSVQQYQIYFTAYAILALESGGIGNQATIEAALDYLRGRMTPDGRCSDLGGTLMAALAFNACKGNEIRYSLAAGEYVLARRSAEEIADLQGQIENISRENRTLRTEIDFFKNKFDGSELVLKKSHLAWIAIISLGLGLIGLAVTLALS